MREKASVLSDLSNVLGAVGLSHHKSVLKKMTFQYAKVGRFFQERLRNAKHRNLVAPTRLTLQSPSVVARYGVSWSRPVRVSTALSRCESKIRQLSSAPGNFSAATTQQPQGMKNSGASSEPGPNFLPPPGSKTGTATLFQMAANFFEKLFRVACSVSFDAQKTL